jgi:hypothetical protein
LYEAQLYINWKNTGALPRPIYDMDVTTMLYLFAIEAEMNPDFDTSELTAKNVG